MKLRLQLAIVCSTLLIIPWSGCEFLRANEHALMALQQQGLESTAQSIAEGLSDQRELIYSDPVRATAQLTAGSLFAQYAPAPPVLDGYFDEWNGFAVSEFGVAPRTLSVTAMTTGDRLYLAITVFDNTKNWDTAGLGADPIGDRLILTSWPDGRRQQYVIATSAPGDVSARVYGRQLASANPDSIRGQWTDVANGYQMELSLPLSTATSRLGIYYVDVDDGGVSTRGNMDALSTAAPPWLVLAPQRLRRLINKYDGSPIAFTLLDRWGWPLASSARGEPPPTAETLWLTQWLYRHVLHEPQPTTGPVTLPGGRLSDPSFDTALRGLGNHSLIEVDGELLSRFAAPIRSSDGVIGVLVTEQPRQRYLSLSASAFEGLLLSGGLALGLVAISLAGFAFYLSFRIKRLTEATFSAPTAHRNNGATKPSIGQLPTSRFNDELDQLAKHFAAQLDEQHRLQDYLRSLPRSLAHEIRTPIAIIRATLETLRDTTLTPEEQQSLLDRATQGLARLTRMLDAMNEANRLEASIGQEPFTSVNLVQLLSDLCAAYQQTFPAWRFAINSGSYTSEGLTRSGETTAEHLEASLADVIRGDDTTTATVAVSPDLVVQALDKLVANATSFSKTGDTITLKLERRGLWWRLSVINTGEPLPADHARLFAPMVSLRAKAAATDDGGNIGLGLYIVALVARHHDGEPFARNRDNNQVEVGFTVRA